jgi:dTDP-4-dehydrorhamnose reductase
VTTRRRLLLTGATGLLGSAILDAWSSRWDVVAMTHRWRTRREHVTDLPADLEDTGSLNGLVENAEPDVVVHAAAWTDVDACEANPDRARTLHRDASAALARGASAVGARFIYISTDSVFSSGPGPHRESDPTEPRSVYARTKLEGELASLDACPNGLVIRTCVVGWNAQPKLGLVEWILAELRAERAIKAFADVWFTPISSVALSAAIERLATLDVRGVLHVGGANALTKLAYAREVADVFGLRSELVTPSTLDEVKLRAPRPRTPTLDSSRFAALTQSDLETARGGLLGLKRSEDEGWRQRIASSICKA